VPAPDAYDRGMMVRHPDYGMGKIVEISGHGSRRTATVQFFNSSRPAKFVLAHSKLEVVGGVDS
jgi:hypothetical protein